MNNTDLSPKVMHTMGDIDQVQVDNRVYRMLRARRVVVLCELETLKEKADPDLLRELAELDEELGIDQDRPVCNDPIAELRAELVEEEALAQDMDILIGELSARGCFNALWSTSEDTDGCTL